MGDSAFAITEINFETGMITVTNIGGATGNLNGHALGQRPNYFSIPDTELAPGESAQLKASGVGGFDPADGEVGLYSTGQFDSSTAILSYVEWGRSGHGRSSVAVAAGIWPADSFVDSTTDTAMLTATEPPATSPDGWEVG